MRKTSLPKTFEAILSDFSQQKILFAENDIFYWSPRERTVYFSPHHLKKEVGFYQLFHELGHAVCNHENYHSGINLLKMEVDAWEEAKQIATTYGITISEDHIEQCLDTYRDWLHLRSTCPTCSSISTETDSNQFQCFNCLQKWKVPMNQQARCYRLRMGFGS